jgi:hypothetical protein
MIKRGISELSWERAQSSFVVVIRKNKNVRISIESTSSQKLRMSTVFRAAHDSTKAVRAWMADVKKV